MNYSWSVFYLILFSSCTHSQDLAILPGAYNFEGYLADLEGKRIGLVVNHTSEIKGIHLIDTLSSLGIAIQKVFTPEHGFKGSASAGEKIEYKEAEESYELISLYGKHKKPTRSDLEGLDVIIFDMQDVGARFYTYISTMQYVMLACAKNNLPFIVLDRPNPNGSYVDGPVLDTAYQSFVGLNPIPIVHGMTIGELALMINEEGWIGNSKCDLKVIKIKNWNHQMHYSLPLKPSPNLPNDLSIALYPTLCLFEGTIIAVGRGTDHPFQQIGHPDYPVKGFSFTPKKNEGSKWPPFENQKCYGVSWKDSVPEYTFSLKPLIDTYQKMDTSGFFNAYFEKLVGNGQLRMQIESGMSDEEIRATWQSDLTSFKEKRKKYLLYDDTSTRAR